MTNQTLLKNLDDLKKKWITRFEKEDMHQPGGGLRGNEKISFRAGYKVAYEYVFEDVQKLFVKWIEQECNCCHCKWLKESRCICGFVYPDKRIDEAEHKKAMKEHHCKITFVS
ncbi:hypothetical protein LCGC14_2813550 [marine sediment metagenome]|uniref:Uncharacterized protein n=1 Tax=marine sediment metagenome TaxID=412755 RepID=A0A0F8YJ71_9ZZZZ